MISEEIEGKNGFFYSRSGSVAIFFFLKYNHPQRTDDYDNKSIIIWIAKECILKRGQISGKLRISLS